MKDETIVKMEQYDAALAGAYATIERLRRELDAARKVVEAARTAAVTPEARALYVAYDAVREGQGDGR